MVMSILHRVTGGALYFGTLLVAWWLIAASSGATYFEWVSWFMGTLLGRLILFGYTWALVHHMLAAFATCSGTWVTVSKEFFDEARQGKSHRLDPSHPRIWVIGYMVRF